MNEVSDLDRCVARLRAAQEKQREPSWAEKIAGYRRAEQDAWTREQDETAHEAETVLVPFHLVTLLETIVAQQVEQTMLLQEMLALLRDRAD